MNDTTTFYIAGFFDTRDRLIPWRDELRKRGYQVLSSWLDEGNVSYAGVDDEYRRRCAVRDLREVRLCEVFVLDTIDETPRGGREVEFGIALARGITTYVVGPRRNVFHYLADRQFNSWEDFLAFLNERVS